jgi:Fe-S-cluster-containing hydrogenase component 2
MRTCPTAAVRVRKGKAVKLMDRCIDCGECIKVCTQGVIIPLTGQMTDLAQFQCLVAIPSPALYAQFDPDVLPGVIFEALKKCGFHHVECLSRACDAVTTATEIYVREYRGPFPLISSFCPTVVRLVQVEYPELVDQMLPVLSPREISARDAKAYYSAKTGLPIERIGAIYLTPCPAKIVSILEHPGMERSYLDAAVAISDLFHTLAAAVSRVGQVEENMDGCETASGVSWAFMGGLPRSLPAEHTISVAGLQNVIRILDDVEKGRLRNYSFIECHACPEGCVGGCLTVENPYVARAKAIKLRQQLPAGPSVDRQDVERRYRRGELLMDEPLTARPLRPLDKDVSKAIVKMRERDQLLSRLPGIDCGACGAPSCRAFAEDAVLGAASTEDCLFLKQCAAWRE